MTDHQVVEAGSLDWGGHDYTFRRMTIRNGVVGR